MGAPCAKRLVQLVYVVLIIGLRLAGKRELAQLNPFDLVVLLTLSNTVQNAIIGNDTSVTGGIIGAATLLLINYLVVRFLYGHKEIEQLVEGDADALIENGQVKMDRLEEEVITLAELEVAARRQGFALLAEVESAILEPGGAITFTGKKPAPEAARQRTVARFDQISRRAAACAQSARRCRQAVETWSIMAANSQRCIARSIQNLPRSWKHKLLTLARFSGFAANSK